jgi:protein translocase SecG subunit
MLSTVLMLLLFLTAVFLILLILIQRGKGGGLAGAFGGMGGQSAFGTKAGDTFTKITIGVAAFWIVLCVLGVKYLGSSVSKLQAPAQAAGAPATDAGDAAPLTPGSPDGGGAPLK